MDATERRDGAAPRQRSAGTSGLVALAGVLAAAAWIGLPGRRPQPVEVFQPLDEDTADVRRTEGGDPRSAREPRPSTTHTREAARLVGRCVAVESGAPLVDFEVGIGRQPPVPVVANEGRFALPLPGGLPEPFEVWVAAVGRVAVVTRLHRPEAGEVDIGTVALGLGVAVRGSLEDVAGRPVGGARVRLHPLEGRRKGRLVEMPPRPAATGGDGRFTIVDLVLPGSYQVELTAAPVLQPPTTVEIPADGPVELRLRCAGWDPAAQMRGVVFGAEGQVLPGVLVQAFRGAQPCGHARTGPDGGFLLFRPPADRDRDDPLELRAWDPGSQREARSTERVAWGAADLRINLGPGPALSLTVTCAGAPVDDVWVQCIPLRGTIGTRDPAPREVRKTGPGRFDVPDLREGPNLLLVRPRGAAAAGAVAALPRAVDIPARGVELDVELHPPADLHVDVRRVDGRPAIDSDVRLLALHGPERLASDTFRTRIDAFMTGGRLTRGGFAVEVARARTDGRGRARLRWSHTREPLTVLVEGDHVPVQLDAVRLGPAPLRVDVPDGGRLRGVLGPAALLRLVHGRRPGEVVLVRPGAPDIVAPVDPDGRFAVRGLVPGRYRLFVRRVASYGGTEETRQPLLEFDVADGAERSIEPSLVGAVEPSGLQGSLRGVPSGTRVELVFVQRDGGRRTVATATTDERGGFGFGDVLPGRYRLVLRVTGRAVVVDDGVELPPGGVAHRTFTAPR